MLEPTAENYETRAWFKARQGNTIGALADYGKVIDLKPTAGNYWTRGCYRQNRGDLDGAIADFNLAVDLESTNASLFRQRSMARPANGKFDDALADCDKAVNLGPKDNSSRYYRGLVREAIGDLQGAAEDLLSGQELFSDAPGEIPKDDFRIPLGIVRLRQGKKDEAAATFSGFEQRSENTNSFGIAPQVARLFLNKISEAEFLDSLPSTNALSTSLQQCWRWYYVGKKRLLAEDTKGAAEAFQKSIDAETHGTDWYPQPEVALARAELNSLRKKPN